MNSKNHKKCMVFSYLFVPPVWIEVPPLCDSLHAKMSNRLEALVDTVFNRRKI